MIQALLNLDGESRSTVFKWAQPFIMPHKTNKKPYLNFHDVNNNASLITVFSALPADTIEEFSQQLRDARTHLTVYGPRDLYGKNKHLGT
jgi:hypothetical protein